MKQAKFTVICPKTSEIIRSYDVQYADAKQLHNLYQEGRKVWHEYHVTAEADSFILSNSHTYQEQLKLYEKI